MKKYLGLIVLITAGFAAFTAAAEVQEGRTLTGTIVNAETGSPLGSANLTLTLLDEPGFSRGAEVADDGTFVLEHLPEGRYRLSAIHFGLQAVTGYLVVAPTGGRSRCGSPCGLRSELVRRRLV